MARNQNVKTIEMLALHKRSVPPLQMVIAY